MPAKGSRRVRFAQGTKSPRSSYNRKRLPNGNQQNSALSFLIFLTILVALAFIIFFTDDYIEPHDRYDWKENNNKIAKEHRQDQPSLKGSHEASTKFGELQQQDEERQYKEVTKPASSKSDNNFNSSKTSRPDKSTAAVVKSSAQTSFPQEVAHIHKKKEKGAYDFHFIHIPKCGGTSMTAILRQVACQLDHERNQDCCTNPGFCDWHAFRRCASIKGCINHFPQRKYIFKQMPTITIVREPVSRLLSAWFYRGHSPNLDFFQVRPWFKEIKDGKRPKVTFDEYIEMVEYQNIQTRMLGADSFPYRNISITKEVYESAVEAIDHIFFIGVQEAYDLSVKILLREMNMTLDIDIQREREQGTSNQMKKRKEEIKRNATLMQRVREVNSYDIALYQKAVVKFCHTARKYPDLYQEVITTTSVQCDDIA